MKTNIEIIYQDDKRDLLIVNKPAGLAVHGGARVKVDLLSLLEKKFNQSFHLIHRIDQATSGLVMLTRSGNKVSYWTKLLKKGNKFYLMIVKGKFKASKFIVFDELPVHSSNSHSKIKENLFKKNNPPKSQYSETRFKVIKSFSKYSLLSAELITGRMHQIRKHLEKIEHPIIGDDKYGDFELNRYLAEKWKKETRTLPLFLFAHKIKIKDNRKDLVFTAKISADMKQFLNDYNVEVSL